MKPMIIYGAATFCTLLIWLIAYLAVTAIERPPWQAWREHQSAQQEFQNDTTRLSRQKRREASRLWPKENER